MGKKNNSSILNHTNPFCGLFMMWVYQYAYSNFFFLIFNIGNLNPYMWGGLWMKLDERCVA
jgi:hypothetical protein